VSMEAALHPRTLADRVLPGEGLLREVALVVGGAALTALTAQISIPLPFTPVPITLQTFAVLLTGAALGAWRGIFSQALYVLVGALGLPVYAGGVGGATHLFGATGGYLVGFVLAAALTGWLAERGWDRQGRKALPAMILGNLTIYLVGVPWLAFFVGGLGRAVVLGFVPFAVGDALKLLLASGLLPLAWGAVGRR
jgi:biotin transport system substrate-specific component